MAAGGAGLGGALWRRRGRLALRLWRGRRRWALLLWRVCVFLGAGELRRVAALLFALTKRGFWGALFKIALAVIMLRWSARGRRKAGAEAELAGRRRGVTAPFGITMLKFLPHVAWRAMPAVIGVIKAPTQTVLKNHHFLLPVIDGVGNAVVIGVLLLFRVIQDIWFSRDSIRLGCVLGGGWCVLRRVLLWIRIARLGRLIRRGVTRWRRNAARSGQGGEHGRTAEVHWFHIHAPNNQPPT